jgi:hypothetical protein
VTHVELCYDFYNRGPQLDNNGHAFFMTGLQLLHHIVAIVSFVGCSFSYLHPFDGGAWKDMKEGIFSKLVNLAKYFTQSSK